MFFDRGKVGPFAITQRAFERGDGRALFKLLVAVAMFQRRQDVQILRILRGMARRDVREVCDAGRLQALVDGARCPLLRTNVDLISRCDLGKDLDTKTGICGHRPRTLCHLKRHTVVLKRYGHFGKVPTSAALMLREEGVRTLGELRARVLKEDPDPFARAMAMEGKLSQIWRVNQKLACMFLSAVCNPDLSSDAPWSSGVDWTHFVVVDSNADLFLASINYRRGASYDERRRFICAVAREIDLSSLDGRLHPYNPRLVQQAMYLFMSAANRRAAPRDCMHHGPAACRRCPSRLADRCPVRAS
jgi:hypothetical protein